MHLDQDYSMETFLLEDAPKKHLQSWLKEVMQLIQGEKEIQQTLEAHIRADESLIGIEAAMYTGMLKNSKERGRKLRDAQERIMEVLK